MKVTINFILMTTAIFVVVGGTEEEKKAASDAVKNRHQQAVNSITLIENEIRAEKQTEKMDSKNQTMSSLKNKIQEITQKLSADAEETTRTAIEKGKPIQSYTCIGTTYLEGLNLIIEQNENLKTAINNIWINKIKKLNLLETQIHLISNALKGLVSQALKKISSALFGYEIIKADAIKKVDLAEKRISEIQNEITIPELNDLYKTIRKQNENKCKELSDNLLKKIQKCVA